MKYLRFKKGTEVKNGILVEKKEEKQIRAIEGDITERYKKNDEYYKLSEVELLAPCLPEKIICVGLNYLDHAKEVGMEIPEEPVMFMKPATSVIGQDDKIIFPEMSKQVDYEAELGVVIKKEAKDISIEEAKEYILGYTCFNDVTARDLQAKDGQWTRAKSFDTFSPIGPVIETDLDPSDLKIELFQNGVLKQNSTTAQMIFSIQEIVSFISQVMTLRPGDLIATGTPPGVGPVELNDKIEVKIEGIGTLTNEVVAK
jgi:2-keto-4-pentenoate hydratase/2-oxohepta-3-ene-1,7-dioic acid hydratase in catechol pathway